MTKKYVDGVPLARQEKIWKREGIELSRATMANWVIQTSQTWLKPLYRRLKKALLESGVIHADETVVQVLKEDGKKASSQSRMWVYASTPRCGKPVRYFEYQPDRKGSRAAAFLMAAAHQQQMTSGCVERRKLCISKAYSQSSTAKGVAYGTHLHTGRRLPDPKHRRP